MKYATVRQLLLPLILPRLKSIEGAEHIPNPPYLIAANHVDFLDGFYVAAAFYATKRHDVFFVSKTNNYGWTRAVLPIDADQRGAVLDRALRFIRQGKIVCNFVEGRRNPGTRLLPGKTGTVRLALATNVPIVPVGISGFAGTTFFLSSLWRSLASLHRVSVRIGKPIIVSQHGGQSAERIRTLTAELLAAIAPLCGKEPPATNPENLVV